MFERNRLVNRCQTYLQMLWNRRRRISISALALVASLWCLLRFTIALNWVMEAVVTWESGAECVVENARWNGWGKIQARSLALIAPAWPGQTRELIRVEGIAIEIQPWRLLSGKVLVQNLHADSAMVNIAERANAHGIFNLMALRPRAGSSDSPIELRRASLDYLQIASLTVDADDQVKLEGQHSFKGSLLPRGNSTTEFEFSLHEIAGAATPTVGPLGSLSLDGTLNQNTFAYSMTITGLSFVQSLLPMLPYSVQKAWEQIDLTGSIDLIQVQGRPDRPVDEATLVLSNVRATIPIPGYETEWVRYEPRALLPLPSDIQTAADVKEPPLLQTGLPRMQVASGTVRFSSNMLKFENFIGKLDSTKERSLAVPIQLGLEIRLPSEEQPTSIEDAQKWFKDVLNRSGVEATVKIHNFALTQKNEMDFDGVELPKPAVQVLGNLLAKTWDIDLDVTVSRAISTRDGAGVASQRQLTHKGTLNIREASGGYFLFPYMLSDVTARIELNNERVNIVSLQGKGGSGSTVRISGTVTEPGDDAGVDLRILSDDLAIDQGLKNSFLFGPRKVFELLYDHHAHANLVQAGLLQLHEFPFEGRCAVDLRVERPVRGGANVKTTGTVSLRDANVICSRFPYPVHVHSGEIILEDTVIRLPREKWRLSTKSNASVSIGGIVDIPRDGENRLVFPDLNISFDDDRISPLLLAAIPCDASSGTKPPLGWPGLELSPAGRMLEQININGTLDGRGTIGAKPDESTTWDFNLELGNGSVTPLPQADPSGDDQILPNGFDLIDVAARVHVTDDATTLDSLTGSIGGGRVSARGYATLDSGQRWFQATAFHVPIDRWIFGFLPADKREDSMLTWGDCNPQGTLDADINIMEVAGQPTRRQVLVDPVDVRFDVDPGLASIEMPCGYLEMIDDSIHVHDLLIEFNDMGARVGTLNADGMVHFGHDSRNAAETIDLEARFLYADPAFYKVLPSTLQHRLEVNNFHSDGAFEITHGRFSMPPSSGGADFRGDILLRDARFKCGPQLEAINLLMRIHSDIEGPINGMRLDVERGDLVIQDRIIKDIHGSLVTNSGNGNFTIPKLEGDFYGGRIWLDSLVLGEGTRAWTVNLGVAGSDLAQSIAGGTAEADPRAEDGSFNCMISLGGEIAGPRAREGRGKVHGFNARMGDLPVALRLLQMSQFMPPISQTFNEMNVEFFLRDNIVRFQKFDLTCPTLQLLGSGSLDLDQWTIHMRFKNRGTIPIASDVLGAATDLLLAVDVSGSISDPRIAASPLPGLARDPSKDHASPPAASEHSK